MFEGRACRDYRTKARNLDTDVDGPTIEMGYLVAIGRYRDVNRVVLNQLHSYFW